MIFIYVFAVIHAILFGLVWLLGPTSWWSLGTGLVLIGFELLLLRGVARDGGKEIFDDLDRRYPGKQKTYVNRRGIEEGIKKADGSKVWETPPAGDNLRSKASNYALQGAGALAITLAAIFLLQNLTGRLPIAIIAGIYGLVMNFGIWPPGKIVSALIWGAVMFVVGLLLGPTAAGAFIFGLWALLVLGGFFWLYERVTQQNMFPYIPWGILVVVLLLQIAGMVNVTFKGYNPDPSQYRPSIEETYKPSIEKTDAERAQDEVTRRWQKTKETLGIKPGNGGKSWFRFWKTLPERVSRMKQKGKGVLDILVAIMIVSAVGTTELFRRKKKDGKDGKDGGKKTDWWQNLALGGLITEEFLERIWPKKGGEKK